MLMEPLCKTLLPIIEETEGLGCRCPTCATLFCWPLVAHWMVCGHCGEKWEPHDAQRGFYSALFAVQERMGLK